MKKFLKTLNITLLSLVLVCTSSSCVNNTNTNTSAFNDAVESNESEATLENTFVNSYEYYTYSGLDFDFVIVNVTLQEGASLEQVTVNEDVNLTDVQSYISKIEENGFYVGKKNVWFSLPATSFTGNIFIPVLYKNAESIDVTYNEQNVTLTLSDHKADIKQLLMNSSKDTFTDDATYEMSISDMFEITGDDIYEDGTQLVLPSSARIFSFKVTVTSLSENVVNVTGASVMDDSGWSATAEGSSISSMKYENMIGKTVQEKDEANFFFIVLDQEQRYSVTTGTLSITIDGVETPIEIRYE